MICAKCSLREAEYESPGYWCGPCWLAWFNEPEPGSVFRVLGPVEVYLCRTAAWFTVYGYGLWIGDGREVWKMGAEQHRIGRLAWRLLRPEVG